ncbi:RMD1 family protein [uncultured Paraglaciecola sp.]|uniref:RMD1 family protein n=1 Tax=uncultured Paraglaciecola sp. TaxID=1765024 RepID=UPI00338DFA2A
MFVNHTVEWLVVENPLKPKMLSMLRGPLFSTKSDILLHFNLLDTPEFFWEYPEEEQKYLNVSKYLDITPRVELLTMKLSTINELHEMLAAEQNHKHSSFLEWIIIILITVEIVLFFVH